jgi:hypothetical protein
LYRAPYISKHHSQNHLLISQIRSMYVGIALEIQFLSFFFSISPDAIQGFL